VATTSVASKKQVEREAAAAVEPELPEEVSVQLAPPKEDKLPLSDGVHDWEDEKYAEEHSLQQLVDRLHDKGEKEVSRIVKVRAFVDEADASLLSTTSDCPAPCLLSAYPTRPESRFSKRLTSPTRATPPVPHCLTSPRTSRSCAFTLLITCSSDLDFR
jgi:hypothetical protein